MSSITLKNEALSRPNLAKGDFKFRNRTEERKGYRVKPYDIKKKGISLEGKRVSFRLSKS